jgi:small nuclear ribonucleoprotein (snRNP)-like protein
MISTTNEHKKVASPVVFMDQAMGRHITVKLTNDSEYRGKFVDLTHFRNIIVFG